MFKKLFICFSIYILSMNIYAQGGNTFKDIKKYLKEKPKFTGYLDGRNSFAEATRNNIFGAFIGASFANRIDLGLAYYQTVNEPPVLNLRNEGTPSQDSFVSFTKYNYFALRFSYMFHKSKKWEISVPYAFGIGTGNINNYYIKSMNKGAFVLDSLPYQSYSMKLAPFELGIDATYLITPWFVFSAGMGYRLNMRHFEYNRNFSAVYYRYGFGIRFGYIYKKIKKTWVGRKCCCFF